MGLAFAIRDDSPAQQDVNKTAYLFLALALIAIAAIVSINRDRQQERDRADALAVRVAELEPIERPRESPSSSPHLVERGVAAPAEIAAPSERQEGTEVAGIAQPTADSVRSYRGSAQAHDLVSRLQRVLIDGTPLQDYQTRALLAAIDEVRSEVARDKMQSADREVDWKSEENERLVQAAAEVLFESQLERFIDLLNAESRSAEQP